MKIHLIKRIACLAGLGAALALSGGTAQAQVITNLFTFDTSGTAFLFPSWAGQGTGSFWDGTQDADGNPNSGSQYIYQDMSGAGGQMVGFQCYTLNPYYPYAWNNDAGSNTLYYYDLSAYTNVSMDIKWDPDYSTIGIDSYNTEAFVGGNGTWGLEVDFITGDSQTWVYLATIQIPAAASNGWAHVNIPIPLGLDLSQTVGFVFKKYTGGGTGTAGLWVDNIAAEAPGEAPAPPTLSSLSPPAAQGLNIYDDGSAYDRQSISTIVTNVPTYVTNGDSTITTNASPDSNYSWVNNSGPVTYSLNIAQAPAASYSGYQVHIMIAPGNNITELAPDYNEANALVLFINRQGDGSVQGQLRYKLNNANNNTYLFGTDTSIFGGSGFPTTNTIVAGYGGLLGTVTNTGGYIGTWSMTMTGNTGITLKSPDGSQSTFAFPQLSDAQAFAGPLTVYWGTQPNAASLGQDVVLSNVAITGAPGTLNVNLAQPLDPAKLAVRASNSALVFSTPTNAIYWLQWSLPDAGFKLQGNASLTGASWTPLNPTIYSIGAKHSAFITSDMLPASSASFFRLAK